MMNFCYEFLLQILINYRFILISLCYIYTKIHLILNNFVAWGVGKKLL